MANQDLPCAPMRTYVGLRSSRCLALVALAFASSLWLNAQTFTVLHNFTGGSDGGTPIAGVTIDAAGNLYGTASDYGTGRFGVVYKLSYRNSSWVFTPLHSFSGGIDGRFAEAGITIGPDGSLFGTTFYGGTPAGCDGSGCGTVYNVQPASHPVGNVLSPWPEKHVYSFPAFAEGAFPRSDVTFDSSGTMYGTTFAGGASNVGSVYQVVRSGSGWQASLIYSFPRSPVSTVCAPTAPVIVDAAGNLYGTGTQCGVNGYGGVYMLTPTADGWTETTLHQLTGGADGIDSWGGLVRDSAGNLYGATMAGGSGGAGVIYQLQPNGGSWTFNILYSFTGCYDCGPWGTLTMDAAGSLYGTTKELGSHNYGNVFKLSPSAGGWVYTSLYDFNAAGLGGGYPYSSVSFDSSGNLYGTTSDFGRNGYGTVWQLKP